jgi:hypothetical protein
MLMTVNINTSCSLRSVVARSLQIPVRAYGTVLFRVSRFEAANSDPTLRDESSDDGGVWSIIGYGAMDHWRSFCGAHIQPLPGCL